MCCRGAGAAGAAQGVHLPAQQELSLFEQQLYGCRTFKAQPVPYVDTNASLRVVDTYTPEQRKQAEAFTAAVGACTDFACLRKANQLVSGPRSWVGAAPSVWRCSPPAQRRRQLSPAAWAAEINAWAPGARSHGAQASSASLTTWCWASPSAPPPPSTGEQASCRWEQAAPGVAGGAVPGAGSTARPS